MNPGTAACQASLSSTISWGFLIFMSIELVMLSNYFILCHPLFLLPSASESFRMSRLFVSSDQSFGASASATVLPMKIQDCFPLGLIGLISLQSKGLLSLQHHSWKASVLWLSVFFTAQLTSVHDYWKNHSFGYTDLCRQIDVSAF